MCTENAGESTFMYLDFYGLKEFPFNITPDPHYLYLSRNHKEAFDHLLYGITARKGFIELTGEVGSGKTTLCRAVLSHLGDSVRTALVLNPYLTENQLLRAILQDFGLTPAGRDKLTFMNQLNAYLLEQNRNGINVALIIDEAQNLSLELLEQIRLLSNLETDQHKLLQIVLAGQPELRDLLNRPELRQLKQRILVRYHLPPLEAEDAARYIAHRLKTAGAGDEVGFENEAIDLIFQSSGGVPRLINSLSDHAMLAGYVLGRKRIDAACVSMAVKQLEGL
jgi:general secretion pathway protein A